MKVLVFAAVLLSTLLIVQPLCLVHLTSATEFSYNTCVHYAVVICGIKNDESYAHTAYFVKWCLENLFKVSRSNIKFLVTPWNGMPIFIENDNDGAATYENVRDAIQWLAAQEGYQFVYVTAHGGGYNLTDLEGGRWDGSEGDEVDEGPEHNGKGVDECIVLQADDTKYWDDDFRRDSSAKIAPLTVLMQTCRRVNETGLSCHSGGFIDDLSEPYTTLISSSNETGVSYLPVDTYIADFTYYFMNALSDFEIMYDGPNTHFDKSRPIDWDYKDWRGAFEYALQHDRFYLGTYPGYPNCIERPWFDDEGDGLPTYANDTEYLDYLVDGQALMRWLKCDINYDGIVDMTDLGIVGAAFGGTPGDSNWNRQADVNPYEDWIVEMSDVGEVSMYYGLET